SLPILLALDRLDLLHGHLELVRDPGIGPALANPGPNLVELRTERPTGHAGGNLAKRPTPPASGSRFRPSDRPNPPRTASPPCLRLAPRAAFITDPRRQGGDCSDVGPH